MFVLNQGDRNKEKKLAWDYQNGFVSDWSNNPDLKFERFNKFFIQDLL